MAKGRKLVDEEPEEVEMSAGKDDDSDDGNSFAASSKAGKKKSKGGFNAMKLSEDVIQGIHFMGFKQPTPIQRKAIPPALQGRDVVAMARTGSGKTAAFLIPLIERLKTHSDQTRGIVLSPTRELAQQTYKVARSIAKRTDLRFCLLQGGDSLEVQFEALAACPDVLIATPGRLAHLLLEAKDMSLGKVEVFIVDEADRLFEMGFYSQLQQIISFTPDFRQTLLFSATMPKQLAEFARVKLREPELIRLDTEVRVSETLNLAFFRVRTTERDAALLHVLTTQVDCANHSTIIFCATKHAVEYVGALIRGANVVPYEKDNGSNGRHSGRKHSSKFKKSKDDEDEDTLDDLRGVGIAHGSMDQAARTASLERFRKGQVKFFVVTDLAARGLDIPHVNNVINYDFPDRSKLFIHRVGRAARQGRPGTAFSFISPDEMGHLVDVMLYLGRPVPTAESRDSPEANEILGTIPQSVIDLEVEHVRQLVASDAVLEQLGRSSLNAHKMYVKTRAEPSKRSVKRSKEVVLRVHPLFGQNEGHSAESGIRMEDLASFRPKKTTFEVEQSKGGVNKSSQTKVSKFLKQVRNRDSWRSALKKDHEENDALSENEEEKHDDEVISTEDENEKSKASISEEGPKHSQDVKEKTRLSAADRKRLKKRGADALTLKTPSTKREKISAAPAPGAPTGAFRDEKFYVSNESSSASHTQSSDREYESQLRVNRLEDAVLDLGDDADPTKSARSYQWDKKKKKYIQSTLKDHVDAKRLKKGAEALDVKNPGEVYDKWAKKTRKRIGGGDHLNDGEDAVTDVRKIARMRKEAKAANSPFGSNGRRLKEELKNEDQIIKDKMTKRRNAEKQAGGKKRVKAGADAKVLRIGKQKPKPGQFTRSKSIAFGGNKQKKGGKSRR